MYQESNIKAPKAKTPVATRATMRLQRETKKRLSSELAKANKKTFGRKVRIDDLLAALFPFITDDLIQQLQTKSFSNADRLEMIYREHIKARGPITKDEFLGLLLQPKAQHTPS